MLKNGKDSSKGFLKLNFEIRPKKPFPGFIKQFRKHWLKLKICHCQFPNLWAFRVSGMGCYASKCEKNKITAPTADPDKLPGKLDILSECLTLLPQNVSSKYPART